MSSTPETRSTAQAEPVATATPAFITTNTGADRIAAERKRQLEANGYDAAHDDEHASSELAIAAVAYIFAEEDPEYASKVWPFADGFRPSADPVRNLERAGALIAAEIDRLLRMRGEG